MVRDIRKQYEVQHPQDIQCLCMSMVQPVIVCVVVESDISLQLH